MSVLPDHLEDRIEQSLVVLDEQHGVVGQLHPFDLYEDAEQLILPEAGQLAWGAG